MKLKEQKNIESEIDDIISNNSITDSILKLNGYLKQYHWNQSLRTKLGILYRIDKKYIQAGKLLYFKSSKTKEEKECIEIFKNSCGNKMLVEFRKLIGNNKSKPPRGIDMKTNQQLFNLFREIAVQEGSLPIDVVNWIVNYERIRNIEIQQGLLKE